MRIAMANMNRNGNDHLQEQTMSHFMAPAETACITGSINGHKGEVCRKSTATSTDQKQKAPAENTSENAKWIKGQWSSEEDKLLVQMVEQHGLKKWSQIAQSLNGRKGKQCRDRWKNHLRPNIKKDKWTDDEDMAFIKAHIELGNKWTEIAERVPGRTENSIKNHWNATKRRQFSIKSRSSKAERPIILQTYIKSLGLPNPNSAQTEAQQTPRPSPLRCKLRKSPLACMSVMGPLPCTRGGVGPTRRRDENDDNNDVSWPTFCPSMRN